MNLFKRKPKEETVSRAEYAAASRAYQATIQRLTEERDSYGALLTEKEAKLAKIMAPLVAANARHRRNERLVTDECDCATCRSDPGRAGLVPCEREPKDE